MTATSAQAAQTSAKAPVQIGKGKEEANTNGFANLLADTISKSTEGVKAKVATPMLDIEAAKTKKSGPVIGEHAKGKGPTGDLDLSVLGEVEEADPKKGAAKLGDVLAELSHKSSAPVGSEVINLKTVLSSKNDDPNLINQDLLALVKPENREKVMESLIAGAKQLLSEQLNARIPKNRVPKTLKGLLETAVRFNMVVSDITLENLPQSKVTKELLQVLNVKAEKENPLPGVAAKVSLEDKKLFAEGAGKKKSPLEQVLKGQEIDKAVATAEKAVKEAEIAKDQPMAKVMENATHTPKSVTSSKEKEKDKTKVDAKESTKMAMKEGTPAADALKNVTQQSKTGSTQNSQQKSSSLEQLLAAESKEQTHGESSQQSSPSNSVAAKQDTAGVKQEPAIAAKMAEARQLTSQLSADIKEAMQNYKPPFTKLSMKLNPERLGEIDVMMVQRGNNVHINLTSNSAALGMLQQNSSDLKAALVDAGLGDATMNFSSNGEDRNQPQEQQRKHSTSEHYAEMSKILDDIDTLELVVPRYV